MVHQTILLAFNKLLTKPLHLIPVMYLTGYEILFNMSNIRFDNFALSFSYYL